MAVAVKATVLVAVAVVPPRILFAIAKNVCPSIPTKVVLVPV